MTNPTPKEILEGLEKIQAVHKDLYESEFEQAEYYPSIDTSIAESSFDAHELIQAAIDYIKATMWVPIKDIPEEWKNGGPVNLIIRIEGEGYHSMPHCASYHDVWYDWQGFEILNKVIHAMLPIPPSALGEPE